VLFNENFTRSVLYTLKRLDKYFNDAVKNNAAAETKTLSKQLGRLVSKIEYADFEALNQKSLQEFLFSTRKELIAFSNQLAKQFFSYS
jgi:uncharacterized alpha-E superfamily protein